MQHNPQDFMDRRRVRHGSTDDLLGELGLVRQLVVRQHLPSLPPFQPERKEKGR